MAPILPHSIASGNGRRRPLNVFITTDTEVWPRMPDWRSNKLAEDIQRDIYGEVPAGAFGIKYQMDVMNAHRLKGVFFVESLFPLAVGIEPLREIVTTISQAGHDPQLHIHTEWLKMIEPRPPEIHDNIGSFSIEEQTRLLHEASCNFSQAAQMMPRAFRAGNYGADFRTLSALLLESHLIRATTLTISRALAN